MADFQAVALGIKPPDPDQGFKSISSILGIKGQQIGLQQKAIELQQQGQQLQQEQLKTQQMQGVQNFFQSFDPTQHIGSDGTTDVDSVHNSDTYKNAGNAKPLIDQTLNQIRGHQLQNKQSLQSLDNDTMSHLAQGLGPLQSDPDVKADNQAGRDKVREFYRNFASLSPQAARIAGTWGQVVDKAKQGHLGDAVYAQQLMGADVMGQRSQQNPQETRTGAGTLNRNVPTGELTAPPGAAPGSTLNPTPVQVAGQTRVATNTAEAQTAPSVASSQGVATRVEQAKGAANNTIQAQDALNRAKAILESPEAPDTGAYFERVKSLKNLMSSIGIDTGSANDMNTLAKNLARYEASRATQAGLGGTDAARELAHAGSPNTQLDNKALLGVVRQSLASEQALSTYAKVQSKTQDPQQLLKNENDFRNIPHLIEAHEYGMSKNAKEADEFLQKHGLSKAEMRAIREQLKEFSSR